MSDFNITVDTSPMANSLNYVNSDVRNVTASVVAMESAVVLAQQEASENICKNVDAGFFILMKSQFDQKIAAVSSEMLSTKQLMESFKNEIEKIMLIMNDDYERIKLRYNKHFSSLNKTLETRIHELDKKAYEISRNYKMSQYKNGSEIIKSFLYNEDTQLLKIKQTNATVKNRSAKSIQVMSKDVIDQLKYTDSVKSILKEPISSNTETSYVPVIFCESDSVISRDSSINNVITSNEASFSTNNKYINQLKEETTNLKWTDVSDSVLQPIRNSFQTMVHQEIADERIAKEMLRLFEESKWSDMEGN